MLAASWSALGQLLAASMFRVKFERVVSCGGTNNFD